ncbi:hypothetical protein [Nocardia sp. alder85J]|uniref:hypothetical protein n=1 Tax=Nocardia sp. alder85J TaxID=2862949 RepID=UPI002256D937|nr:hypothetical protein [Nocardia sp. alder85J]MCX4096370.1 hypothetical protein [Nocardia sp. alder85J]
MLTVPDWQPGHLGVLAVVVDEVDRFQLAKLRDPDSVDPLDGRLLLCRLKVAAALMALDGRTAVDVSDWVLAGVVMEVSSRTREAIHAATTVRAVAEIHRQADEVDQRSERIAEKKYQRCRARVLTILEDGPASVTALRRSVRSDLRPNVETVLSDLEAGHLVKASATMGDSTRYHLVAERAA